MRRGNISFFLNIVICPLFIFYSSSLFAQVDTAGSIDSGLVVSDIKYKPRPHKSPMLALGLSAALPGAGQFYTENYWKIPIIWGVGGYWIYEWTQMNTKYRDFRTLYSNEPQEQYLKLRDFYRDERDKFAWFLAALYVLNLVDAFAGAHLYDFDVSPDLTYEGKLVPKISASIKIPF